jgi:hypothetical protein
MTVPSFVAPQVSRGYNGAGALGRFAIGFNRKAAENFMPGRIFCGRPVPAPDRVGGRLFPENALFSRETRGR